jgi:hypothetical protein
MTIRTIGVGALLLLLSGSALAQTSTSFQLEEYTLNAGGTPSQGTEVVSASFRITVASIGDSVSVTGLGSASFQLDSGFEVAYPPPGEVGASCGAPGEGCLQFTDVQTLAWPAERSAGAYDLYRDEISFGYGVCEQQDLGATTTTDLSVPSTGNAFYYLVTVENRLAEEGTKGFLSVGSERLGATMLPVCP